MLAKLMTVELSGDLMGLAGIESSLSYSFLGFLLIMHPDDYAHCSDRCA